MRAICCSTSCSSIQHTHMHTQPPIYMSDHMPTPLKNPMCKSKPPLAIRLVCCGANNSACSRFIFFFILCIRLASYEMASPSSLYHFIIKIETLKYTIFRFLIPLFIVLKKKKIHTSHCVLIFSVLVVCILFLLPASLLYSSRD